MEFSSKSRSNAPGLSSPTSFANFIKQQKLGLLILASIPYSPSHIVFSTRNLTKSIVETNAALSSMSNLDKSSSAHVAVGDDQGTPGTGHSFTKPLVMRKPCVLSSNYISQRNDSLPLTTCVKHGTAGFLPLDYARTLPEYTCTTQIFPVHRVVHCFDDCVLEFPDSNSNTTTTHTQIRQEINVTNKCSRCEKELSDRDDIYMFRDDMFCSNECRNEVSTVCFSCETRDEDDDDEDDDDDDDDEFSDASSMEYGETIFTIDYFT